MKLTPLLLLAACTIALADDPRSIIPLKEWEFTADSTPTPPTGAEWKKVQVPHVFRQSGLPDESVGWYRQNFHLSDTDIAGRIYLFLDGAASAKSVYVNGQPVGQHRGAFSRASFDLTPALHTGDNVLDVRVGNTKEDSTNSFSRSSLFYINGGMFRPARLIKTASVHIAPLNGCSGVFLTPGKITPESAQLDVETVLRNAGTDPVTVSLCATITGPDGHPAGEFTTAKDLAAGETSPVTMSGTITAPKLWDLGSPNLYSVRVSVLKDGKMIDEVTERTGFRTIAWKEGKFYLNGRETQFRGVCKHAQDEYDWNAVSDDTLRQEWRWMLDMGVNAVRLAHYPHSAFEYDLSDDHGVAVWAENGFAGQAWTKQEEGISPDGERLTREMVRQNWNHPSILFWSAGNEAYLPTASHYATLIRKMDSSRLITYATNKGDPENCDLVAHNTYNGWYGGNYADFQKPDKNALVSETGAGNWITQHVPYGTFQWKVDKFEPEEYAEMFTEYRLQTICRDDTRNRPMFFWWNFREFYNLKFKNNRNTKGLVTLAGMPKDLYYLFQAFFKPDQPLVHLAGRHHFMRSFAADNGIKAYSNLPELTLIVNGETIGTLKNGSYRIPDLVTTAKDGKTTTTPGINVNNVFFWKAALRPGRNVIEVQGGNLSDRMVVYQCAPEGTFPQDPNGQVIDLVSSNPQNPVNFVDRPVEEQGPFYSEVDGSSDNTFDVLPAELKGSSWIATKRLSEPTNKTDISFRLNPKSSGGKVFVLFSKGSYPTPTLKAADPAIQAAATDLRGELAVAGFKVIRDDLAWRDHELIRADAELWAKEVKAGECVNIPGHTLDYVILKSPES